jgi:hypothetical protein
VVQKDTTLDRQQLRNTKLSIDEPWSSPPNDMLIGLNGDEILHEMMITNGVNQICMPLSMLEYPLNG